MAMSDQELSANESEVNTSLTKILEAVEEGRDQTSKRYRKLIERLEILSDNISDLGDRMDAVDQLSNNIIDLGDRMNAVDQFLRNPLAALFPVNTQLRIVPHTQNDGTTSLSFTLVQPSAQTQPVQAQALPPAAASQNAPNNNAITQATAPPQPNLSTNAAAPTAVQPKPKPGYDYKDTITKRALDPSPPKITTKRSKTTRPRAPPANEPVARRKRKNAEATEAGESAIAAGAKKRGAIQDDDDQHIPKRLRKGGGPGVAAADDDHSETSKAPALTAGRKRKAVPTASVSSEGDEEEKDEDQPQPPKKKGRKNKK